MSFRNPFITRSRYRDDWNLNPRFTRKVHKDLQNEVFDKVPLWEGVGKHLNDYSYTTPVLYKWFRSHVGEPWAKVQKLLKERLPDPREYGLAYNEVQYALKSDDGQVYLNSNKWWGTRIKPLSEAAVYAPFFYVDLNGILRELPKVKYVPLPAKVQMVTAEDKSIILFKRKGIIYKAPIDSELYESVYTTRSYARYRPLSYDSYGDVVYFNKAKGSWMKIRSKDIRQASKKDIERHRDVLKLITDDLTIGSPELDRR